MNLKAEEAAIVGRLKGLIPELEVKPYLTQVQLAFLASAEGDILVQHIGGSFAAPEATPEETLRQDRDGRWRIVIRHRNLSPTLADACAYEYLERVRKALTGFTVPGVIDATKLYPIGPYGFLEENEGIWFYAITFAMTAPEVG